MRIDRNGTAHVLSPIDTVASARGERIWYVGRPRLDNPPDEPDRLVLDDTLRRTVIQRGPRFDSHAIADLTPDEEQRLAAVKQALLDAARPEAEATRAEYVAPLVSRLVAAGATPEAARRQANAAVDGGRLELDAPILFDREILPGQGLWYDGWTMLANRDAFVGATGADPIEPNYDKGNFNKAKWYRPSGGRGLKAFSFAHLERTFDLVYDAPDIVFLVTTGRLPGATIPERMAALREIYAEGYVPQDEEAARRLLEENGVPPFSVLDFLDEAELAPAHIVQAVRAGDWSALADLRSITGVFFEEAWAKLREEAELGLLAQDAGVIDWDEAEAGIARVAAEDTGSRDTGDQNRDQDQSPDRAGQDKVEAPDIDIDPVVPSLPPPAPYPIQALPGLFGETVAAVARIREVDVSVAATIGLAAAALAVGKSAPGLEVTAIGKLIPASLNALVASSSSERKTSTDQDLFA